eukprot:TRINITY_DN6947_c0_g1_i1.p3 TRINITY_DN6947_c0_g1~~TRINITY_DN6947_c0_g1_i1.p3  ORF type:complete len:167 (+),score=22.78 TRINITY_DN6947_c0_g1_i1:45-503(+)
MILTAVSLLLAALLPPALGQGTCACSFTYFTATNCTGANTTFSYSTGLGSCVNAPSVAQFYGLTELAFYVSACQLTLLQGNTYTTSTDCSTPSSSFASYFGTCNIGSLTSSTGVNVSYSDTVNCTYTSGAAATAMVWMGPVVCLWWLGSILP